MADPSPLNPLDLACLNQFVELLLEPDFFVSGWWPSRMNEVQALVLT